MPKKKKRSKVKIIFWSIVIVLAIAALGGAFLLYRQLYKPNVSITDQKHPHYLYVPTPATFEDVVNILDKQGLLINDKSFRWAAEQMKYTDVSVRPGKYLLKPNMSNKE